jgi:predicted transcriptional regulator
MAFIKHVGKHGDRKVCILFRQVPGEDHMALVIYPEVLPAHWQDSIQKALESDIAQQSEELADALHRAFLPDGQPILQTLHQERMIKKVRTGDIIVTPTSQSNIRLDELNKMLNEMKLGEEAIKKMAQNDASRGMVAPEVKRKAEAEYKSSQTTSAPVQPFQAPAQGALSDRDLAANMLAQAQKMEADAKQLVSEANRMKKEAARMDPRVVAKEAPAPAPAAPASSKRGRPSKTKAVADATQ